MVHRTLSKRIWGFVRLMLIYGNTPDDIKKMILRRKYKFLTIAVIIIVAVTLMGCSTAKQKSSAVSEFWKALGSGDVSILKKMKGVMDNDDDSWDTIDLASKAK